MAITPVRFSVKSPFTREGHEIQAQDYAGNEISRADVNSAGGRKITYVLHAVVPLVHGDMVTSQGVDLDVTDLVASGQIDAN